MNKILTTLSVVAFLGLAACDVPEAQQTTKDVQAAKAAAAAESIQFTENAEIENIKARLQLTSNPGQIGFVLLMSEAGAPISYMSVKGKVTSGGKRLTQPQVVKCLEYVNSTGCSWTTTDGPSDEGTYGHSGEYVYFWTTSGQYVQWNGKYLYSDKPFRTRIEPVVVAVQ